MGRRSRHSAKTGDQSIYKSRSSDATSNIKEDDSDNDAMYNEVERYHNRKEEEQYLKLDSDGAGESSDEEDDGITKNREGVFDLGIGGSSDEEDEDEEEDSDDERERAAKRARQQRAAALEEAMASSDDDDSDGDGDDDDGEGNHSSKLLNWGDKKHAYYHGDTADLEIGQDVEDAYLEEEAGREVERARLDVMDDADFMLDGDDGGDDHQEDEDDDSDKPQEESSSKSSKKRKSKGEMETIQSVKRSKQLSKLSKKEKMKLLKANHPELLPLLQHFSDPIRELGETTVVAAGALLKNGVAKGAREAEAVGATPAGLRYLLTKCMLQASKALNVSLYLLLKADQASNNNVDGDNMSSLIEEDDGDDIRHHPVMERLNQLSQLTDKLQEGVEDNMPELKQQMNSLVKAAALMAGGDLSSSDDDSDGDAGDGEDEVTESSEIEQGDEEAEAGAEPLASDNNNEESSSDSDDDNDDETEAQEAIQRRIMMEAKFALRNQDIDHDTAKAAKKRKRRLAPSAASSSDYGDETEELSGDKALAASRKLASTMNSIVQKSSTSKKKKSMGDEEEGDVDEEYAKLQRGLSMMEEQFGKGSDEDDDAGSDDDEEGLADSDEDDFYRSIKSKSKAKKEAKKQMYAVAPKYPRLEGEVEGERAIGRTIMKNRGLVAHKAKINRNPRVKKREQYRKALIRRKGAVREIRTEEGHAYGGEATGIKSGISRSRKLGSGR